MTPDIVYDDTICLLGEGPLWHPLRKELFWFDIIGRTLHRKGQHWRFERIVTAAGWIDEDRLLVASDRALSMFQISTGQSSEICPLEADNTATRSNDGRADPQGGFWIGTMGLGEEKGAGAIWRWYRGELRRIIPDITIPNAICFAPDGQTAYFADTPEKVIRRIALEEEATPDPGGCRAIAQALTRLADWHGCPRLLLAPTAASRALARELKAALGEVDRGIRRR